MKRKESYIDTVFSLFVFLLSFVVKTYKIENGNFVIWDEAHFGKFASRYLSRSFYFDVHPPLGKMMTALSGLIFGQPLDFEFKSGDKYPEVFDYAGARRFHAFIASFVPFFAYLTLKEMKYKQKRRFLLSLLFIFDSGFTSIGRLILLDSHLLFFTSTVVYSMTRLYYRSKNKTDLPSLFWLGLTLGCVMSVKWIGLLTTSLVGIFTIYQLWIKLISKDSILNFAKMFMVRALFLIVLPISLYVILFYIHFKIVKKSSSDDGHMSSYFQVSLEGNPFENTRKYIAYGTGITMKSNKSGGGYLHSHNHAYPDSDQNQVTSYHHKDENNGWAFQKVTDESDARFLTQNDVLVIMHLETKQYLNVSGETSLISEGLRVECLNSPLTETNLFVIEHESDEFKKEDKIKSLTSRFRLKNTYNNCYLSSSLKSYPSWGFNQGEILCIPDADSSTLWNIEENVSEKFDTQINPIYTEIKQSAFLKNFIEHNKAMFITNQSFKQDDDLEPDRIVSRPHEWFLLRRGLRMCAWDKTAKKFYMFGNPILWYSAGISVFAAPLVLLSKIIKSKRHNLKYKNINNEGYEVFLSVIGWSLHYLPFFIVGRVLYFHHYFPALFFAIFSLCFLLKNVHMNFIVAYVAAVIAVYLMFAGPTYGFVDENYLERLKIIKSWDFID